MKKMFKRVAVLLSFMLLIATIAPTAEVRELQTNKKSITVKLEIAGEEKIINVR